MCFLRHALHGFQQRFVFFVQPDRDAVPAGTESGVIFAAADGNAAPQKRRIQPERCAQLLKDNGIRILEQNEIA